MKALVYTGVRALNYLDVETPKPKDGEALVKIEYVGICGSDMHAYLGHDERRPAPLILGHEAAGLVVEGEEKGKRVTINPLVTCGECSLCLRGADNLCPNRQIISMPPREGAFAEYIAIPARNLVEVPNHIPLQKAALAEPIACGWNAVRKLRNHFGASFTEQKALVLGGGAIGVGAALSLRAQGIENITIVEPHQDRRDFIAKKTGFLVVGNIHSSQEFDLAIDGVGIEATRKLASTEIRPGGAIAHIGLGSAEGGLDIRRMTLQEIAFYGCYTYTMRDFIETTKAIFDGRLGELDWVETRLLKHGNQAFSDLERAMVIQPKIILKP